MRRHCWQCCVCSFEGEFTLSPDLTPACTGPVQASKKDVAVVNVTNLPYIDICLDWGACVHCNSRTLGSDCQVLVRFVKFLLTHAGDQLCD